VPDLECTLPSKTREASVLYAVPTAFDSAMQSLCFPVKLETAKVRHRAVYLSPFSIGQNEHDLMQSHCERTVSAPKSILRTQFREADPQ
jgi:hypothetical protein